MTLAGHASVPLEWQCIPTARQAERYRTENGTAGTRQHTPTPLEADCMEIFDTGRTLLATLGHPLFEPVANPAGPAGETELFAGGGQVAGDVAGLAGA